MTTELDFKAVLASCVHDMKNGLCMMLQAIDTLALRLPAGDQQSADEFARLHYEAARLNGDLVHLLTLYRSDCDSLPLNIDEHYVDELIEELAQKNLLYLQMRQLTIERDVDSDLAWYFDRDMVMNLLNDILVNAMRYCRGHIHISASVDNQQLVIAIADDGPGFPQGMLELGNTASGPLALASGRTGLGLHLAGLIAKTHHRRGISGEIQLANGGRLGGSVFTLKLP